MTLYPRFLLIFSKNKYNNTRFYNEEFLRAEKQKVKNAIGKISESNLVKAN